MSWRCLRASEKSVDQALLLDLNFFYDSSLAIGRTANVYSQAQAGQRVAFLNQKLQFETTALSLGWLAPLLEADRFSNGGLVAFL
jgi:hypothetical protein